MELYSADNFVEFGWYSESETKPLLQDFKDNGRFCKSGVAYPTSPYDAKCTSTEMIKWDGDILESPYACDPENQDISCELHFKIDEEDLKYSKGNKAKAQVPCMCSMSFKTI